MKQWLYSTLILLLLNGCASRLPSAIREAPAESLSVQQVQRNAKAFEGREIRWGGEIIEVRNAKDHSDVLVLGRELKKRGEPIVDGAVDGRFIARFGGFVDPAELPEGKRITVRGRIVGLETRDVGQFPYPYPVVEVTAWYLWPDPEPYHPYYDPWWPYYPYPYPYPYYWGRPWGYPYWW